MRERALTLTEEHVAVLVCLRCLTRDVRKEFS
jgi:hypothetical protein